MQSWASVQAEAPEPELLSTGAPGPSLRHRDARVSYEDVSVSLGATDTSDSDSNSEQQHSSERQPVNIQPVNIQAVRRISHCLDVCCCATWLARQASCALVPHEPAPLVPQEPAPPAEGQAQQPAHHASSVASKDLEEQTADAVGFPVDGAQEEERSLLPPDADEGLYARARPRTHTT